MPIHTDTLRRFFSKVSILESGCWEWLAARNPNGYGVFGGHGLSTSAHRIAYQWFVGPVAQREQVDHLCRNRSCVNPAHLEAVSQAENGRRARAVAVKRYLRRRQPAVEMSADVVEIDALDRLHKFVEKYPTQKAAAEALEITPAYLNDLINMRRDLSDAMLTKLGLKRTVVPK